MSTIRAVGSAVGQLPFLAPAAGSAPPSGGITPAGGAATSLERALRRNIDEAFAQGGSASDIASRLEPEVSKTLQQHGVSDEQRSSILDQLRQLFAQGGDTTQLRQAVTQLLSGVAQSVATSNSSPPSVPGGQVGQAVDFSA